MFARLQPFVAALAVVAAILIEAANFIPLREVWSGALVACVWLWAHHGGWLEWLQRADEVSPRQIVAQLFRRLASARPMNLLAARPTRSSTFAT